MPKSKPRKTIKRVKPDLVKETLVSSNIINPSKQDSDLVSGDFSDLDKILLTIDQKLEKSATNFQHLIYFVVFLVIAMQFGIFWVVQKPQFNFIQNQTEAKTTGIEKQNLSKDYDTKVIDSFVGNNAIVDLGSSVNTKQKYIEAKKVTDCQTQVVPAPESGCGFSLLTSSLGLSDSGIILKSIRFIPPPLKTSDNLT